MRVTVDAPRARAGELLAHVDAYLDAHEEPRTLELDVELAIALLLFDIARTLDERLEPT